MLNQIYEALAAFFGSKPVSDYLFPVISGVYITFITADVIQFIDMKRSAFRDMEALYHAIMSAPIELNFDDWMKYIFLNTAKCSSAGNELFALGHKEAGNAMLAVNLRAMDKMVKALISAKVPDADYQIKPGSAFSVIRESFVYKNAVANALVLEMNGARDAFANLKPNLAVVLQFSKLSALFNDAMSAIDQQNKDRCAPCCNCGKRPDKVL